MEPMPPRVERKVKASTVWSYLAGVAGLAVLNAATDINMVAMLPDALEVFVAPLVPALAAGVAGYIAKHTMRPDLGE